MEEDLGAPCEQYCVTERDGSLVARGTSEIVLKCCTFQHWVYQWTNGNILVTDMEGKGICHLISVTPHYLLACERRRKSPSRALLPFPPCAMEPSSQDSDLLLLPVPVLLRETLVLLSFIAGVGWKMTNVRIATNLKG